MENKPKVICGVCNGKGGWSKEKKNPIDDNWIDCGYCDGYGFHNDSETSLNKYESHILNYNRYKKIITELLQDTICSVTEFTTDDMGQTLRLRIVPYGKTMFSQFTEYLLKVSAYSQRVDIELNQKFYYDLKHKSCFYYWELVIRPKELSDLDGIVDVIRLWKKVV